MNIPNNPELSGSIILERGTHFLSKQIILHMKIYAKMTGRKPILRSHCETLLWSFQAKKLRTAGSRKDGPDISPADSYYHGQEITILKPKIPLTEDQIEDQWEKFYQIDAARYNAGSFLSWITVLKLIPFTPPRPFETKEHYQERIIKLYDGLFRDDDKAFNCYRMGAHLSKAAGLWPKDKDEDFVSIFDLAELEGYEVYTP